MGIIGYILKPGKLIAPANVAFGKLGVCKARLGIWKAGGLPNFKCGGQK